MGPEAAAAAGGGSTLGTPDAIQSLPGPVRDAVVEGFAASLHTVFLVAVPFSVVGLVLVLLLLLKEVPLRTTTSDNEPDLRTLDVPFEATGVGTTAPRP